MVTEVLRGGGSSNVSGLQKTANTAALSSAQPISRMVLNPYTGQNTYLGNTTVALGILTVEQNGALGASGWTSAPAARSKSTANATYTWAPSAALELAAPSGANGVTITDKTLDVLRRQRLRPCCPTAAQARQRGLSMWNDEPEGTGALRSVNGDNVMGGKLRHGDRWPSRFPA